MSYILILLTAMLGPFAHGALEKVKYINTIAIALIGLIFGYILVGVSPWLLAFPAIMWLGEKPGVGHPKGLIIDGFESGDGKLERWQPEMLRERPYLALTLRGGIYGLPSVFVAWWVPQALFLVTALAFALPAGMWLATRTPDNLDVLVRKEGPEAIWCWSEVWQYPVAGLFLLVIQKLSVAL